MDRVKTVFNIFTMYWKFIKQYVVTLPTTDEEWEKLVRENTKLTREFVSKSQNGTNSERQLARDIAVACLNYLQNRSREENDTIHES